MEARYMTDSQYLYAISYLTPTLNQVGIYSSAKIDGINAGLQMWNLILSTCAALLMERLGRRILWLFSDCGIFVS
ncbi:hypothetical protein N7488_003213 [Penicillium malachiteum]|nr:hypothetical protein N7488_003213 [Penicillium malachiteum]